MPIRKFRKILGTIHTELHLTQVLAVGLEILSLGADGVAGGDGETDITSKFQPLWRFWN